MSHVAEKGTHVAEKGTHVAEKGTHVAEKGTHAPLNSGSCVNLGVLGEGGDLALSHVQRHGPLQPHHLDAHLRAAGG